MRRAYALLVLPLFANACGHPSTPHVEPGRYVKTVKYGDLERSYVLIVPKGYDNKTPLPLVVLLHGWSGSAEDIEQNTGFGAKADKEDFLLAIPNGTAGIGDFKGWNTGFLNLGTKKADDVKFAADILDQTEEDILVDDKRIFVAGHSNGAMMAYDLGANLSDRIAAIAVVSGTTGIPDHRVTDPKGPVSAIIFHGMADDTIPYDATGSGLIKATPAPESAKWWAEKDGCGSPKKTSSDKNVVIEDYPRGRGNTEVEFVTIVNGAHSWPTVTPATDMIWDFFKTHPKS